MKPDTRPEDDGSTDADLLARIARRGEAPDVARRAQAAFYARHVRYLYGVLLRQKTSLLPLAGISAEDLAQETFQRAFDRAHTFEAADELAADHQRMRARAWLGRIATNLLADHLQQRREVPASPYLEQVTCRGLDDDEPPGSSPGARLVAAALETLSERERDVLRVSALHHRAGEAHQRLPNAVSAELAERWKTTNDNVRAIRVRAMKKLKGLLMGHEPGGQEREET
jgi:RNA polymerase sigma factor (sigma-70 family)